MFFEVKNLQTNKSKQLLGGILTIDTRGERCTFIFEVAKS